MQLRSDGYNNHSEAPETWFTMCHGCGVASLILSYFSRPRCSKETLKWIRLTLNCPGTSYFCYIIMNKSSHFSRWAFFLPSGLRLFVFYGDSLDWYEIGMVIKCAKALEFYFVEYWNDIFLEWEKAANSGGSQHVSGFHYSCLKF